MGGRGSKILETQLSSFTKVKTISEWNWIQPDNYYSFDPSHQCSSHKSIRNKHAVLALNSVLVCYCQAVSISMTVYDGYIKMAAPINYIRGLCIIDLDKLKTFLLQVLKKHLPVMSHWYR